MGLNDAQNIQFSYCTLFDSNYLDKGIVAIRSFLHNSDNSRLYVLAMNDICHRVLCEEDYKNVIVISIEEFMNEALYKAKSNRSNAEFCWTCTASLIAYIFDNFDEPCVTYIDADLCFYNNPNILVQEMFDYGASVQIVKHGFKPGYVNSILEKRVGKYCVEFNTFANDDKGREILGHWKSDTLSDCSSDSDKIFGDQFYLNEWPKKYKCVHVLENQGAGLAPWNVNRYRLHSIRERKLYVTVDDASVIPVYFFHFHNLKYLSKDSVFIDVNSRFWRTDKKLVNYIYKNYLKSIENAKKYLLDQYNVDTYFHEKKNKIVRRSWQQIFKEITVDEVLYKLTSRSKRFFRGKYDVINLGEIRK